MKTNFDFNFDLNQAVWIHINNKLLFDSCKLVIRKKFVNNP